MPIKTIFLDRDGVINKEIGAGFQKSGYEIRSSGDISGISVAHQYRVACIGLAEVPSVQLGSVKRIEIHIIVAHPIDVPRLIISFWKSIWAEEHRVIQAFCDPRRE